MAFRQRASSQPDSIVLLSYVREVPHRRARPSLIQHTSRASPEDRLQLAAPALTFPPSSPRPHRRISGRPSVIARRSVIGPGPAPPPGSVRHRPSPSHTAPVTAAACDGRRRAGSGAPTRQEVRQMVSRARPVSGGPRGAPPARHQPLVHLFVTVLRTSIRRPTQFVRPPGV